MIDFTTLQANPIPPPILELQNENLMLQGKKMILEKIIYGIITVGVITLIYNIIKDAESRKTE
jgi:hypothetical protein